MSTTHFLAAAAVIVGIGTSASAQNSYPYPQQSYPPQYQQPYPQSGYGYPGQQGYGTGGGIQSVIDQLLGNRYNVSDRSAVSQCATAAVNQAARQVPRGNYGGYNQGYAQPRGYAYDQSSTMRVTAITNVERRSNGLRVSGLLSSGIGYSQGYAAPGYPQGYANHGYANQGYTNQGYGSNGYAVGDLTFRCNVDFRGAVTSVRVRRNEAYRR